MRPLDDDVCPECRADLMKLADGRLRHKNQGQLRECSRDLEQRGDFDGAEFLRFDRKIARESYARRLAS